MDPEIKAMSAIAEALGPLDAEAVSRVLSWASERYGVVPSTARSVRGEGASAAPAPASGAPAPAPRAFADFHELFDATNPSTGPDKALVAAYWFQVVKNQEDLDSQQLNTELKNLGHPSSNITRDLDGLINKTPRYVMQVRKEGTTKQARKKYKVTREGIKAVERMLTPTI